jgi:non-ribosomal peptide synthetase-like protein
MQLAIAKTGAAWLPFDADAPVVRVATCLQDANAVGLVTCLALLPQWVTAAGLSKPRYWASETLLWEQNQSDAPMSRRQGSHPNDPAYVIYTSGSTGKPKGIAITQGSICHFLRSENAVLGITSNDKVYQGFSVAFDMSFEEIWISYLVGATLWIAPKEIAVDPEALPKALADNHITVLHAVPTLLALFTQDVPLLRLINLGGESCPQTLVERWAKPHRLMFNTYGPTEATVSASLARLQAGEPVTIGTPLPNYGLMVIAADIENGLRLLPRGHTGELCITGPGVALGYLGRPELTAEKFLQNPWSSGGSDDRIYRTGDLARIDEHGQVQCLGRADDQVKVRGFRVELGEIEAVIAEQPGVGTVAVVLRSNEGAGQLVAFVVGESDTALELGLLRTALAQRLPTYMVPSRFESLREMPRLTSGKIDKNTLKAMPLAALSKAQGSDVAENDAEQVLFEALEKLFPGQAIQRELDFFSDLGGHSLMAARLASAIRMDPRFANMTVRDIYVQRRIGNIAQSLAISQHTTPAAPPTPAWTPPSAWRRWRCGMAQAAAVPALVALRMVQWLAPFFTYHFFTGDPGDSMAFAVGVSVLVFLLATVMEFLFALAGKWLIAGCLQPGRYPLWGWTYYRWWLSDRLLEAAPTYLLSGSSLYAWWLRALGARIGRDVQLGSLTLRAPDLLHIGDGASIGNAVNFENARVMHGQLLLGRIDIGANAYVGSYCVLEGNTALGPWAHLDGQSALPDGKVVPAQRVWAGSPARDSDAFDPCSLRPRTVPSRLRLASEAMFFFIGSLLVATLFFLPAFPTFMFIDWLDDFDGLHLGQNTALWQQVLEYFVLALPASVVMVALTALLCAGIRWSILPRLRSGSWPVHSNVYCGKWLVNQIQEHSLQVLHGVYATVFAPMWYRLLGAKVGRGAEISTALGVVPDMLTLGDDTFIADAVLLGDEEIDGGWMTMQPTVVSRRSFVGNAAYVPDGTIIPENVLIGVLSRTPPPGQMAPGDTWLGSPAIALPARETTAGFPEALTFRPSWARRLCRGLIEAFRVVAPHALVVAVGYTVVLDVIPAAENGQWGEVAWDLTLAGLVFGLATYLFGSSRNSV